MSKLNFAVFVSGNGSNLQALINAVKKDDIKANLALVVSNNPKAFAIERAEKAGIKTVVEDPKKFTNKQSYDRQLVIHLKEHKIDFVVLAGYMKMLTPFFIKQFPNKIINVHPSLLPSFKGVQGIKDAFTYGAKVTGATVHFVDEKMDHGPIILQESVKVQDRDTLETITEKIHKLEHQILPKAISLFVDKRIKLNRRKVKIIEK